MTTGRLEWWRRTGLFLAMGCAGGAIKAHPQSTPQLPVVQQSAALAPARLAFQAREYAHARALFSEYLEKHPGNLEAEMGVANCDLASRVYETAELEYRKVTDQQPEFWPAHKNLVIVEAALGRWGEFDREREVLRLARERGAPGISARESDVIDAFDAPDGRWIVRQYFEPVGRSLTRYNFERFSTNGRVEEYISLESSSAAQSALSRGDVIIGRDQKTPAIHDWALNWYTGKSHGTILRYPKGEPSYETVRAAVRRWLRIQHAAGR